MRQKGGKERRHHSSSEVTHSDTTTMTCAFIWVLNHWFKFHTFPDVEVSELLDRDITPDDYEMCQHSMSKASNCTCERWLFFLPIPRKLPLLVVLSFPYIILHFPSEPWNRFDDDCHYNPISTGFVSPKYGGRSQLWGCCSWMMRSHGPRQTNRASQRKGSMSPWT